MGTLSYELDKNTTSTLDNSDNLNSLTRTLNDLGYKVGPGNGTRVAPGGSTLPPGGGQMRRGRNARNIEINAEAADTQEQAGMLQTASAQTMTTAVNTFANTVAAGGQMNARSVGSTVLTSFISAFGTAAAGNFARYGGVMRPYSDGGIARGRNAGYPAILHGTEAVVPLPNGNSIPVEMTGSGGGVNNVSVSVNMGDGTTNVEGGEQGGINLGKVIAGAVQEELQKQNDRAEYLAARSSIMALGFQDLGSTQRVPDKNFTKKVKPTVLRIQFGDGYEQRVAEGINSLKETYTVGFNNRPKAEIDDIVAFFDNKKGTTALTILFLIAMPEEENVQ